MSIFFFPFLLSVDVFQFLHLLHKVGVPVDIASSFVGLNICEVTAGIKKYKSITKKKKKEHNKMVLLTKTKLNTVKVLIS